MRKNSILKTKGLLNWRILRPSMDSKHVRVFIWDFLYHPQNGTWNPLLNKKENFEIFLVAQLTTVLARQEVLEATWCLVWDSQWEERNI